MKEEAKKVGKLATVVGPTAGESVVTMIDGFESLADSLDADLDDPEIAKNKAAFEKARNRFQDVVKQKEGLTALGVSPAADLLYVAVPEHSAELTDFTEWGLDVTVPRDPDPKFPYWENLSWENADKYQPDLILMDDRTYDTSVKTAEKQPTWKKIKAADEGARRAVAGVLDQHVRRLRRGAGQAHRLDRGGGPRPHMTLTSPPVARPDPPAEPRPHSRGRARLLLGLVLLFGLLLAVCLFSITMGSRSITLMTIWDAFTSYDPSSAAETVVREMRVPRTLLGLSVGAALGLSGAILQGVTRNPLAEPGIMGINTGAAAFIVFGIMVLGTQQLSTYIWLGFLGAAVATVMVYAIASFGREGATPIKLALAGAAVTAAFYSLTNAIVMTNVDALNELRFWQVGSLAGRYMPVFWQTLPFIVDRRRGGARRGPRAERAGAGGGRRHRARAARPADPSRDVRDRRAAVRRGDRCLRPDRLRRPGRAPPGADADRPRLPLDPARTHSC